METRIIETTRDQKLFTGLPSNAVVNTIFWTTDYESFRFLSGNRDLDLVRVAALKKEILNNGWYKSQHLIVNSKKTVYDGQHRLQAVKEIYKETGRAIKISYEVDDTMTLEKIRSINSTGKAWTPKDYIQSNIKLGYEDYKFIKEIQDEFKFPFTAIMALIASKNGHIKTHNFRSGEVKISNKAEVWQNAGMILEVKKYFKNYNTKSFVSAMSFFFKHPSFSFTEFIQKLSQNREMLYPVTTVDQYKKLIQDIYNYRRREKITFIQA